MRRAYQNDYPDYYDHDGHRALSRTEWSRSDLPEAVRDRLRKDYHARHYTAYRIERPDRDIVFEINWGDRKLYLNELGREVEF